MSSPTLPKEMKAILQPSPHSTKLTLTTLPIPRPTDPTNEHLIKVLTTSPCKGELHWASSYPGTIPPTKTPIPSQDLCGIVVSSPPTSPFPAGTPIYARIPATRPGAAAEYTLARTSELARKPACLSPIEAAAVPLSALTAWQALFVHGGGGGLVDAAALYGEKSEDGRRTRRVFVTGATGGVGSWVVQLAREAGVGSVVGVCGRGKGALARELGVTEVVDYTETTIGQWLEQGGEKCDLVIDCVGGDETMAACWGVVKEGNGVYLSIVGDPESVRPKDSVEVAKAEWFLVEPLGSNLEAIGRLIEEGRVRPVVDSVWAFEESEAAFGRVEEGHARGKVVIKVDEEALSM